MNKRFLPYAVLLLLLTTFSPCLEAATTLQVRAAALFHPSQKFRHAFHAINPDYQIQGTFALNPLFEFWAEVDYWSQSKHHQSKKSKIEFPNGNVGILFATSLCFSLEPYIGAGFSYGRALVHREGRDDEDESKSSYGAILKIGARYWLFRMAFLDFFTDYTYQNIHLKKHMQVGGIKIGLGVGVGF